MVVKELPAAVGGGADLVRDVDAAFARERRRKAEVEALDAAGGGLHAPAGGLAVGGGPGGAVERPDAVAASRGDCPAAPQVPEARGHAACHLATGDDRLGERCGHHEANH